MTACTRKHCSYAKCFCPSLTSFYQQVFVDLTVTHLTFSSYAAELTCFAPNVAQTSCGPREKTQRVKSQWRPSPSFLIWHSRRQTRSPCPVEEYTVAVLSSQNPTIIAAIFFYYFVLGTSKMALFICVDCPCTVDILTFLHCDSLLFDVVCDSLEYIMIVVVHTSWKQRYFIFKS